MSNEPNNAPELTFQAGAPKSNGDRLVIAQCAGQEIHRDEINVDLDRDRLGYLRRLEEILELTQGTLSLQAAAMIAAAVQTDSLVETSASQQESPRARSQASSLVALTSEFEFFHSPDGECFATIGVDGRNETYSLSQGSFKDKLSRLYYQHFGGAAGSQAVQDALSVLRGKALYEGAEHKVFYRRGIHEEDGRVFIDLGDSSWRAVEISPSGWQIISNPPVKFLRNKVMRPLPLPERQPHARLSDLRRFINADEPAWILLASWLVAAAMPTGPYPVCVVTGEQGTAKSTTTRILLAMIDPSEPSLRSEPRDLHQLMINAKNSAVLAYDNLSFIDNSLSDGFCRLATGGGFSPRKLFSDHEEVPFNSQRPVILNGIEELATRADLLDRCVLVTLRRLPPTHRRTEREFWNAFNLSHPTLLGALFDTIAIGLRNLPDVCLARRPRMADFAAWATACESQFCPPGVSFLSVYEESHANADDLAIEASPVADCLVHWLRSHGGADWEGKPNALLTCLSNSQQGRYSTANWPKTPKVLSDKLRRVVTNLSRIGVDVSFDKEHGERRIRIRTTPEFRARCAPCAQLQSRATVGLRPAGQPISNVNGTARSI